MDLSSVFGVLLLAGVFTKEVSYLTPNMIFQHKPMGKWLAFGSGLLILGALTARFASGWLQICFGVLGIITVSAMWLKQGVSMRGVLTVARGQELYPWNEIGYVTIAEGTIASISWFQKNGSLILTQKYAAKDLPLLRERITKEQIQERSPLLSQSKPHGTVT